MPSIAVIAGDGVGKEVIPAVAIAAAEVAVSGSVTSKNQVVSGSAASLACRRMRAWVGSA